MGREIRRVPLDFKWPLNVPWRGFMCPYESQECKPCDGGGLNPATKQISDDWYDFARTGRKWCYDITQDEVDALVKADRLYDFTHTWKSGDGWKPKNPPYIPTAEEVNSWAQYGLGHDAINHWICVEARARRLGVYGKCEWCNGEGEIWFSDKVKELSERWHDEERYGPPTGEGWQLWETVSEGSPISPVFATEDEFQNFLIGEGYSESAARNFIKSGWAMSMVMADGKIYRDIESADLQRG